jgi:hypothetical protein
MRIFLTAHPQPLHEFFWMLSVLNFDGCMPTNTGGMSKGVMGLCCDVVASLSSLLDKDGLITSVHPHKYRK